MIALALLVGGAIFLALYVWLGTVALIVLAGALAILVFIGVGADAARYLHDRRVAYDRWRRWHG